MPNIWFLILRNCLPYAEINIGSVIYCGSNILLANINCKMTVLGKMSPTFEEEFSGLFVFFQEVLFILEINCSKTDNKTHPQFFYSSTCT